VLGRVNLASDTSTDDSCKSCDAGAHKGKRSAIWSLRCEFHLKPLLHFADQRRSSRIGGFFARQEEMTLQVRNLLQRLPRNFPFLI
jgi:phage FluMu gp28-like protein